MRTTIFVLAAALSLTGCERWHRHHEHRGEAGELCHDHDDCERGLTCVRASADADPDHDDDRDGVCTAATPAPTPAPCDSTASVTPGGIDPCAADGGAS